jgi:hypothetical protein
MSIAMAPSISLDIFMKTFTTHFAPIGPPKNRLQAGNFLMTQGSPLVRFGGCDLNHMHAEPVYANQLAERSRRCAI